MQTLGGAVPETKRCLDEVGPSLHRRQRAASCQLLSDEKLSAAADFLRFQNLVAGTEETSAKFFSEISRCLSRLYSWSM